jgi:Spy/CpxP family protein refolding chaperone
MKTMMLVLLLTVLVAVPVFSQTTDMTMKQQSGGGGQMVGPGCMHETDDMADMCMRHAADIGLTDDQMMKMKLLHREMQKKQARFKADLKIAEIELMEVLDVKDFDLEKANTAVKKIEGIKAAHHLEMVKAMKEMRAILTDEQFKKMKKMMPMKMGEKKPGKKMMKKQK